MATPDTYSLAQKARLDEWRLVRHARAGTKAMRENAKGEGYLPQFQNEGDEDYQARLAITPFTAHYEDSTRALAAKPFSDPVHLVEDEEAGVSPDERSKAWADDLDLAGNNVHVWSHMAFEEAVHMGGAFALVEYPRIDPQRVRTRADQRASGARPFVRLIPVDDVFSVKDRVINGRRQIVRFRFRDDYVTEADFEETTVPRVREILRDATGAIEMTTWDKVKNDWVIIREESGPWAGISEIPVAPYVIGRVDGDRFAARPTMLDVAEKQVEHFQHSSRIVSMFEYSAFPILQGKNMNQPTRLVTNSDGSTEEVPVDLQIGPRSTLWTGVARGTDVHGAEFGFIEPSCTSLAQALAYLNGIEDDIRTMALEPVLASDGTDRSSAATTSALNAERAHCVLQAWALHFKDWLERIFQLMHEWENRQSEIRVAVVTDFTDTAFTAENMRLLREARAQGDITRRTFWRELQRAGVLGDGFDAKREEAALETEGAGLGMRFGDDGDGDGGGGDPAADPGNGGSGDRMAA